MTNNEKTQHLNRVVQTIADALKPEVLRIEAGPMTTQGHYDRYLGLISDCQGALGEDLDTARQILRLALFKAGANQTGVNAALQLF